MTVYDLDQDLDTPPVIISTFSENVVTLTDTLFDFKCPKARPAIAQYCKEFQSKETNSNSLSDYISKKNKEFFGKSTVKSDPFYHDRNDVTFDCQPMNKFITLLLSNEFVNDQVKYVESSLKLAEQNKQNCVNDFAEAVNSLSVEHIDDPKPKTECMKDLSGLKKKMLLAEWISKKGFFPEFASPTLLAHIKFLREKLQVMGIWEVKIKIYESDKPITFTFPRHHRRDCR